ncbi:transposase, partial [Limosilactobacillus reuteri]|uniref:transposase n=1 Tax=Limosilactobacillus reuteri TaxID=1598 RepID=UPI001E41CE9E
RRAVEKYHAKLREKTSKLYEKLVEKQVVQEMAPELVTSAEGMEVMEQELAEKITKLDEEIKQEPKIIKGGSVRKRRRRFLKKLRHQLSNDLIPRAKKYERAENIFQGRNSYSKTDHDATFMCMKEDPMMNRELKPGYNLQIATHKQFVLDYGLFSNPTDTRTLVPFLTQFHALDFFEHIVADAGYGSEYNYTMILDRFEKQPVIPYTTYQKEQKRKFKNDPTRSQNWEYNAKDDYYIDHQGVRFSFYRYSRSTDKYGFKRDFKIYRADKHQLSVKLDELAKTPGGRQRYMKVNPTWNYYKAKVKDALSSDEGKAIYRRRKFDVEPVFGHMKRDFGIRRTHLRGQRAVENDIGLALMALNLTKFGQSISRLETNFINNLKSGLRFLDRSKLVVRILLLENQELIVNSQPLFDQ